VLRLRFDDFARATRSHTLPHPTASTSLVLACARLLLRSAFPLLEERGVTLVGVAVANLEDARLAQLTLPLAGRDDDALDAVVDRVRDRFGSAAIRRAILLDRAPGLAMPLLPD
jgi:DNA polymerase IV